MRKIKDIFLQICQFLIISIVHSSTDQCWDKFDSNLRNQCSKGEWAQRYFYDHASMTCQLFWWDGCKSNSRNMFDDLLTCQWLCEEEPRYKTRACLEPFDEHYRDECNGGLWRQNYYFDKQKMRCTPFWFDGCTGQSANLFPDLSSCVQTCEKPVGELPSVSDKSFYRTYTNAPAANSHTHPHRHHLQRPTSPTNHAAVTYSPRIQMDRPNAKIYDGGRSKDAKMVKTTKKPNVNENICEIANPCENNSTCIYDKLKKFYFCECNSGFQGKNCTEFDERDPCAKRPCKNGGTCVNKPDKEKLKINFECFCATGFGGDNCNEKPCDPNPCHNNGTCRTTKGNPSFFCECSSEWGGKMCNVEIPNTNNRKYGKNVELLSSGKPEWIENLRKHSMRERKPSSSASMMSDMSGSSNYTEPDDALRTLNGTDKHPKKSQTLRLPAGESSASPMLLISQTLLLTSNLFFFISKI